MKSRFNTSVPARKPKTQIGRVLSELTSTSEEPEIEAVPEATPEGLGSGEGAALEEGSRGAETEPDRVGGNGWGIGAEAPAPGDPGAPSAARSGRRDRGGAAAPAEDPSPQLSGRERIAALRERLTLAAQPRPVGTQPRRTAAAVQEVVQDLRSRLDAAIRDRTEIARQLEEARASLGRAQTELERERRGRADLLAQAEERAQVADEAVAEAEALAAERDLVLEKLAERQKLDDEQAALLAEAEAALERQGSEREEVEGQLEEMRDVLDLRTAQIAELESRLQSEKAQRSQVEARCRTLEAEVDRLTEATDALEAIEDMVGRGRRP